MTENGFEVISATGRPDVAEVFVGRERGSGRCFEFVDGLDWRHPRHEKWIINVSTQFGCPVKCLFCDAGGDFAGNIPAEMMLSQVKTVLARHLAPLPLECRKLKVHFARMGEPALNPAVPGTMARLPELIRNPNLWVCAATIAPEGTGRWFSDIFDVKEHFFRGRFQLQFSLNSTDEDTRRRLMPFPHAPLGEVARMGHAFWRPGDRKVVLNFALMEGIPVEPAVVRRRFDPEKFAVKLTPLNPTARGAAEGLNTALRPTSPEDAAALVSALSAGGFDVVTSIGDPREDEVGSNCGQAVRRLADLECGGSTPPSSAGA